MLNSRARAIAIKHGEHVPNADPKEVYYGLVAKVMEDMFLTPIELDKTDGPAQFEDAFSDVLRTRAHDSYFRSHYEDVLGMHDAIQACHGRTPESMNILSNLYGGANMATKLSTSLAWTVRARNQDQPAKEAEFTLSLRVLRRLAVAHLSALANLTSDELPQWGRSDECKYPVFARNYFYDSRGLWLPKDFNDHPIEAFGPRIGCPLTLSGTATRAFMGFVKKETTNPARNILILSSQE